MCTSTASATDTPASGSASRSPSPHSGTGSSPSLPVTNILQLNPFRHISILIPDIPGRELGDRFLSPPPPPVCENDTSYGLYGDTRGSQKLYRKKISARVCRNILLINGTKIEIIFVLGVPKVLWANFIEVSAIKSWEKLGSFRYGSTMIFE